MEGRRGFLGQVFGILVGTQAPFVFKEQEVKQQDEGRMVRLGKLLICGEKETKKNYKIVLVEESGVAVLAPGIKEVERADGDNESVIKFICEDLLIKTAMTLKGMVLTDKGGFKIREAMFSGRPSIINGDVFKCTYTMYVPGEFDRRE